MTTLVVWGTRPEAIKLAPVVVALRRARLAVRTCSTGQHRHLRDQAERVFRLKPDIDLAVMRPDQSLTALTCRVLDAVGSLLDDERPALVVVQGDTTSALASALAASYRGIPVAHVEAGLRTGDVGHPFPEELNRVLVDRIAALRLAPTPRAASALRAEGLHDGVLVTGNTAIDALRAIRPRPPRSPRIRALFERHRVLVMTVHRRESLGRPLEDICRGVLDLLEAHPDTAVLCPVHLNPRVAASVRRTLRHPRAVLTPPLDYDGLLWAVAHAALVLTDSGGIQEEAPSLGAAIVVLREKTERAEGIAAGCARLAGIARESVFRTADRLLRKPGELERMRAVPNPFGDGRAAPRIAGAIRHFLGEGPRPAEWIPEVPARRAAARRPRSTPETTRR